MLLATDYIGMSILMDPALAFSVPNDDPPHGTADDPVGYTRCYNDFNKAVSQSSLPMGHLRPIFVSSLLLPKSSQMVCSPDPNNTTGP